MVSITIEIPDELAQQLAAAGLLEPAEFVNAIMKQMALTEQDTVFTKEVMLAAVEETFGMSANANWTMDDVLAMKREERDLEEKRINR